MGPHADVKSLPANQVALARWRWPELSPDFERTFQGRFIKLEEHQIHAVVGGNGPPLLLLHGWPQTWYAWRLVMPALARRFTLVAVDSRGVGLSDKPTSGYDSGTLARDCVDLMRQLGHARFAVAGHDVGMWTAYAMAADFPEVVARLAVIDATIPGLAPSPPLLPQSTRASEFLWHFNFNRTAGVNERLVQGREEIYFGHQFDSKAASSNAIPESARAVYFNALRQPQALRASFEFYRTLDATIAQNLERKKTKLRCPVLAVGGTLACGDKVANDMRIVADSVREVLLPGVGHFVPEEAPPELAAALIEFLGE